MLQVKMRIKTLTDAVSSRFRMRPIFLSLERSVDRREIDIAATSSAMETEILKRIEEAGLRVHLRAEMSRRLSRSDLAVVAFCS